MTPKEKADSLMTKFRTIIRKTDVVSEDEIYLSKQCALITVEKIMNAEPRFPSNVDWDDCGATHQYYYEAQMEEALKYWQQVKTEIENL